MIYTHYYYSNFSWRIVSRRVDISRLKYHTRRGASSVMRKIRKYPRDVLQYVRYSYCIDDLLIIYLTSKEISSTVITRGTFDVSCGMLSNVIISHASFKG